jgi:putative hydrolase of the HAD superfamily
MVFYINRGYGRHSCFILNTKHIFFDLDHTLWDFKANSRETLGELFAHFSLAGQINTDFDSFLRRYEHHNEKMWEGYRKGHIQKSELRTGRFERTFREFGVENEILTEQVAAYYLEHSPRKTNLISHATDVLHHLSRQFELHIITNGFDEVQSIKLQQSGIDHFFREIITSEQAAARKPDPLIFSLALQRTGAKASESAMVGDSFEHDVLGAMSMGFFGVYYNPAGLKHNKKPDAEVRSLHELKDVFDKTT